LFFVVKERACFQNIGGGIEEEEVKRDGGS
jgi:hypothetical protein